MTNYHQMNTATNMQPIVDSYNEALLSIRNDQFGLLNCIVELENQYQRYAAVEGDVGLQSMVLEDLDKRIQLCETKHARLTVFEAKINITLEKIKRKNKKLKAKISNMKQENEERFEELESQISSMVSKRKFDKQKRKIEKLEQFIQQMGYTHSQTEKIEIDDNESKTNHTTTDVNIIRV